MTTLRIQHFVALVVLSLATVPGARAAVLAGPITNAANGHLYYLLSRNTWTASEAEARGLGGHLVTINDAAENQWVLDTFLPLMTGVSDARLWIGLNDAANEGQFVWASGEPVTFTNWYPGEPNNLVGVEHYAAIIHLIFAPPDGRWNDISDLVVNPHILTLGIVEVSLSPVAATQPAEQFMPGSVRLNGQADPRGSPTLAWFEWGMSLAYGNATPPQSVGSGSNVVAFSNVLVGLVSGTEYHFRARASNAFGFDAGVDQTFNLSTQRPVVTTLAADQLSTTSARLRGQVDPRSWPTTAWFEWGTDTNYGNVIGMQDVGQGSSVSNVNVVLGGLVIGTEYHFRALASNAFGFTAGVDQTFNLNTHLPVVTTLAADQLSTTSARLRGQVNPRGWPTAAWFEWGTDTNYGNVIGMQDVGQGSSVSNVNVVLGGLVIGTEYHFRAIASNAFGLVAGLDQTFNLNSQRPVVTTLAADQLSTTSARLRGQVNPRGWPTAAWFEWGTNTNYGNVIGMQDVGQGSSVSILNVVLNGLTTGTDYHYRLVATNAFGAGYGADQTFDPGQRPPTTTTWTGAAPSGYWSAPANWSPPGMPVNSDELVFPGGLPLEDMVSTNDLPDSIFRSIRFVQGGGHTIRGNPITLTSTSVIINSGTNVIACDLTLSGTPHPTLGAFFIGGSGSFNSGELTVIGNVGGGSLWVGIGIGRVVIRGQFTGGSVFVDWYSTLALYGDNPHPISADVWASTLLVQGSQPNLNIRLGFSIKTLTAGSLSGDGVVGDVTGSGGITPDSTLSVKNISDVALLIRLNGTNVGEYGRLVASGDVSPSSGGLLPSAGFNPQAGQVFTIVEKTSPGPITNAIFGPEGTVTYLNGKPVRISYVGGDGNDVTLTVLGFIPKPIPGLRGVDGGCVAWGDYDNDGRLDFLLTGYVGYGSGEGPYISQLWRNTGSGFSNVTASLAPGLPGVGSSLAWGDYDNDGRLDFLLTGSHRSQIWRNTGAGFSNVTASVAPGLPGLASSSVAWGDYDNDGWLDFLLTGTTNFFPDESPIYFQSQLWRNTGSGFSNVTASVAPGLPGLSWGSVAWADYDNDGWLDLLLTGGGGGQLWRNTGSGFSNVTASVAPGLPGGTGSSAAWGDYDNDGRLDFLLTGYAGSPVSQLWRNTGSGFSNVTASVAPGLPGVYNGSAAWGDYDNDGRLDFLLTGGVNGLSGTSQLWRNTGGGFSNVTASVASGLPGSISGGSAAWGDYDNDGRLDFLLTPSGQLWRNNMPVASNAPPAAPTGLSSTLSGATVSLSWNPPADDRTPSPGLNYNVRIGTTPGASDVLAPMALTDGLRLLPALGNAQTGTNAFVVNVAPGRDYHWSVQAVDTSFAGSPFAAEQQFTVAPRIFEPLSLSNGHFQFSFSNEASVIYTVLGTTNVALPLAQWNALGPPVPLGGGLYRFTDLLATNHAQRFYLLRAQ